MIEVTSQHSGAWDHRLSHTTQVVRVHVSAPRMLTPQFRGKLPYEAQSEWGSSVDDPKFETEALEWLANCCQGLWRMDLLQFTMYEGKQMVEVFHSWRLQFERKSDLVLYKLART